MAMPSSIVAAAGAAAPPGGESVSVGSVIVLFGTIVLLLGLFALGVVILARSHRRRLAAADRATPQPHTDAWAEAGRRLEVSDEGADR